MTVVVMEFSNALTNGLENKFKTGVCSHFSPNSIKNMLERWGMGLVGKMSSWFENSNNFLFIHSYRTSCKNYNVLILYLWYENRKQNHELCIKVMDLLQWHIS